jgi:hypothetical protein
MFFLFENKHIVAVLILAPSSLPSLETAFLQGCKSSQKRYGAPWSVRMEARVCLIFDLYLQDCIDYNFVIVVFIYS